MPNVQPEVEIRPLEAGSFERSSLPFDLFGGCARLTFVHGGGLDGERCRPG
jgi:hypothetical protein